MAAKYPEEGNDEDLYPENQGGDQQLLNPFEVPTEANTLVLDDTASDIEENNQYLRGSQVATKYNRSCSEGSYGSIENVSLDLKESNFAKLVLVSSSICQDVMREIIRNRNPKGTTDIDLHNTIHGCKTLRDKVAQYTREGMLLFPNEGATVKYKHLDFTVMYKVARYALSEQIAPNEKWLASPKPGAKCLMSSIEKLRLFRNDCSHSASASFNDADFQTKVDEVTDVILRIELLLRIPNTYSKRVRRLTKASLSQTSMPPSVIELETKSVNLEKQIVKIKDAPANQTDVTDLFNQWKKHHQELVDVHRKLEELYKASSTDPEELVPLLQRNINAIEDAMRETLAASQKDEEYFVETKGTETAMKTLTENNMVIIAGRKGNGKESLAHHLLFSLMSKSECQTHILDRMCDVRKCFKTKSHKTVIVLLQDVFIEKTTKALIKNLGKEIFKTKSNRYLIITSAHTTHLVGLQHLVNLSAKEFELSTEEKKSILRSHLDRCSKESAARLNEREINEIVNIKCSLEFPLACFLFTSEEKYFLKRSNFFRYPIDYFLGELRDLTKNQNSEYRIFFELLLQQDESSPLSFVNPGTVFKQGDMKERMEKAEIEVSDLAEIGEQLSQQGTLIHRIPNTPKAFSFSNETVEHAAQILLLETNFTKALEMFKSEILVRCIAINPRLEETCLFTTSSSKDQTCVAEKVLNDIFNKNVGEKSWSSELTIWNDKDFADLFARILFERLEKEPGHRSIVLSILKKCAKNSLLVLCKAIVESLHMSQSFADDFSRFVSHTLLDACRIKGNLAIVQVLAAYKEADLSFCKDCKKESEGKHQSPLECAVESNDQDVVHFLLESGSTIPHSKWTFWNFLKVAAEKQDTFLCNISFIRTLSLCCRDKATIVNSRMEEFVERSLKLDSSRELDRNHFFFDCLLLIGIDDSLYSAFKDTILHGKKLPKGDQCENSCHMILESSLDPEMELRTLSILANMEFEMLNEKDKCGYTPLAKAVTLGKSNHILSQMLLQNANADETDSDGKTALHLAILSLHPDAWVLNFVNTLTGPNIRCKDIMGVTPVKLCISQGRHRINTLRRLLEILQKENALPKSLFHDCVESLIPEEDMLEIISTLKEFGSDPNREDDSKVKPIAKAVKHLYLKIVNTLLEWNVDVEDIDSQQNTILHYCCYVDTRNGEELLAAYNKHYSKNATSLNMKNAKGRHAIMAYLADPAVSCTSSRIVWRLLNMEPDLSLKDEEGNTAFHYLMQSMLTDEEVLNFTQVMINDFHVSVSIYNACGLSPLMLAFSASRSRFNTVKFILSLCDCEDNDICLPAGQKGVLQHCIRSCMSDDEVGELVQLLIRQGGLSTTKPDVTGLSPLFTSIQHSLSRCKTIALMLKYSTGELCTGVISELIKHDKLDPNVVDAMHRANIPLFKIADKLGCSVFHFLIQKASHFREFHDLVVSFLPFGHDINHVNSVGLSPLFYACREEFPGSIVSCLLSNGARGHMPATKESALHLCVRSKRNDVKTRDVVIALVNNNSIDIDAVDAYHTTALASAVCQGKFLTTKALLENGADPNIPDRENKIALHHCVAGTWSDQNTCAFLQLLLPKSQINWQDGDERSALDIAACHVSFSRIFSIILLLTENCKVKTVDRLGRSPIHNTVRCLTGKLARCKLERLCRMDLFLNFGMSPICKDDEGETAIGACIREHMHDEIKVLNRKQLELEICKEMMSMLLVGEVDADSISLTFTETIGVGAFNEEKHQFLRKVACCLHGVDISKC